jgi:hypothetical protein
MLSTTPSSGGELLVQQGELAGRRYRFEAIVCENPTCQCDHVTLKCFAEMPEASLRAPIVVCLEMDLEQREITNLQELKADPTARALATAVAPESGEEEWSRLKRIYWELKQYWTEHTGPGAGRDLVPTRSSDWRHGRISRRFSVCQAA